MTTLEIDSCTLLLVLAQSHFNFFFIPTIHLYIFSQTRSWNSSAIEIFICNDSGALYTLKDEKKKFHSLEKNSYERKSWINFISMRRKYFRCFIHILQSIEIMMENFHVRFHMQIKSFNLSPKEKNVQFQSLRQKKSSSAWERKLESLTTMTFTSHECVEMMRMASSCEFILYFFMHKLFKFSIFFLLLSSPTLSRSGKFGKFSHE